MNKVNLLIVEDDNNTVEEYKSELKVLKIFILSALQTTPQKP